MNAEHGADEKRTHDEMVELIRHLRDRYASRGMETFEAIIGGFAWRSQPPAQHIVAAAIRVRDTVYQLPPPARHCDVMKSVPREFRNVETDEGFVTNGGSFVSRAEALAIAREAGQIIRRCGSDHIWLYSENLW